MRVSLGYEGDGFVCTDVNECLVNNGGCSLNPRVQCVNNRVRVNYIDIKIFKLIVNYMVQDGHFFDGFFFNNYITVQVVFNTRTGFRLSDDRGKSFFRGY